MARRRWIPLVLLLVVAVLFALCLITGSIAIPIVEACRALFTGAAADPTWVTIVREVRLPEAGTAACAGAGLAVGGLVMQTLFRNPLAGPDVLGITSGSSLGVALVMLAQPLWAGFFPVEVAVIIAAIVGAFALLALILTADRRIGDGVTLLIVGLMIGYVCGALINVLQSGSGAGALKGFVLWGMGSFASTTLDRLPWLFVPVALGTLLAFWNAKALDALLLGADYAASMGVEVRGARRSLIAATGVIAGTITAFCGPIAFIGLATPHLARALVRGSSHRSLLLVNLLLGAAIALGCDWVLRSGGPERSIPLNALTSLLGAPVVVWVLVRRRQWNTTRS